MSALYTSYETSIRAEAAEQQVEQLASELAAIRASPSPHAHSVEPGIYCQRCTANGISLPTPEALMRDVLSNASSAYRRLRRKPVPFWSEVGRLTSHGSGYSAAICWHYGYHPDTGEKLHA